jgi:hypothetical protein
MTDLEAALEAARRIVVLADSRAPNWRSILYEDEIEHVARAFLALAAGDAAGEKAGVTQASDSRASTPPLSAREEALEEAAKICDETHRKNLHSVGISIASDARAMTAFKLAERIRSLASASKTQLKGE